MLWLFICLQQQNITFIFTKFSSYLQHMWRIANGLYSRSVALNLLSFRFLSSLPARKNLLSYFSRIIIPYTQLKIKSIFWSSFMKVTATLLTGLESGFIPYEKFSSFWCFSFKVPVRGCPGPRARTRPGGWKSLF